MMTQSVMTQAANLFGSATGSVTSKGKQTGNGFNLMVENNMKALQNLADSKHTAEVKPVSVQKSDINSSDSSDTNGNAGDQVQAVQSQSKETSDTAKATGGKENIRQTDGQTAVNTKEEETQDKAAPVIDEQLLNQIISMLQAVTNTLMEKLNLSPEEFNQLLKDQGMTVTDLLEPENMKKFILAANGETNIYSVLTNEELAGTMKELLSQQADIKANSGLQLDTQQIKEILTKAGVGEELQPEQTVLENLTDAGKKAADVLTSAGQQATDTTVKANDARVSKADAGTGTDASVENGSTEVSETRISGESSAQAHTDTGREEEQDLKTPEQFQLFADNLLKAAKDIQTDFGTDMGQAAQLREIVDQIIERIKISVAPDQASMELQLNPESLGKVNLTVQSKDGVMTAQFVVQNEVSKEAIESQLSTLKETLNQQGIKVDAIEVTVSADTFQQNYNEGSQNQAETKESSQGKRITLEEAMDMNEIPEEESEMQRITGTVGSQVDYTA